jgi:hypothetical protein
MSMHYRELFRVADAAVALCLFAHLRTEPQDIPVSMEEQQVCTLMP